MYRQMRDQLPTPLSKLSNAKFESVHIGTRPTFSRRTEGCLNLFTLAMPFMSLTALSAHQMPNSTEQTFDSCTSRLDVYKLFPVQQTPMDNISKNVSCTSILHVGYKSNLRSVVRSYMHP